MKIRVQFFSYIKDLTGCGQMEVTMAVGSSLGGLHEQLQARFPQSEVRWIDTVCRPTKQRQQAAVALARQCDVVIVVGGAYSNNTRELAATCRREGVQVHQVQGPDDLCTEWFLHAEIVGITAGTSTPDRVIQEVEDRLRIMGQKTAWAAPALVGAGTP